MLSKKDRAILAELQADSRLTMQQLAGKVGMSSSACWRRVRALEDSGVIDRYAVIVDPAKAGFSLSSMTMVSLARHEERNVENFVREVKRHPEFRNRHNWFAACSTPCRQRENSLPI